MEKILDEEFEYVENYLFSKDEFKPTEEILDENASHYLRMEDFSIRYEDVIFIS
jgi:hypothetical protein